MRFTNPSSVSNIDNIRSITSEYTVLYPEIFLGIPVHICTVYMSGTEGPPLWLETVREII